ncbi:MAG: zinc-ribbon domain-containing protein [Peptococcaceae bacterium]|nr:zinc-ribbon domain-containing protein [Peptococcaceae bacterium]
MKQQILSEISSKLSVLGIPVQNGNGADITISTEFLDAGWSTGSKKISYEASVFANEQDNVIYMYEKTTEVGHGLSFGGGSGSSFQSGKTLFRKVKSVQYGLDGKAYEYSLDLGAIPKAVKETAKQYGWKFKTVLNKNKAMYPAGYVPTFVPPAKQAQPVEQAPQANGGFCSNCGMQLMESAKFCDKCGKPVGTTPQQPSATPPVTSVEPQYQQQSQPQYKNPQGQFYSEAQRKSGGKGGTLGLIGFILLGILLIVMLLAAEGTPVGWVVSLVLFAVAFFIQRKLKKKGCLLHLILWIITGFLLLVVLTMFTTGEFSFTTAGLKNAHMTTAMDSSGKPSDKVSSYSANAPQLVAVAELRNAPVNTKVKFVWRYITGDILIKEYSMDSGDSDANVYVFSNLTNDRPWPEGKYRVEMYIEDRKTPDAAVDFEVMAVTDKPAAGTTSSQSFSAVLPYEKSFTLNDGKSIGKFRLFVSDGTGLYQEYKGQVICEFHVKFDTSSLPADFKMKPEQATGNNEMGLPALDGLIMAVCSDTEAYHKTGLSYAQAIYNNGNIKPFVETEGATANISAASIKELAKKYPKMQVLRYNQNEVGMTKTGDTWTTHAEKAFGLHPPVTEGNIPWDEILKDLGLK